MPVAKIAKSPIGGHRLAQLTKVSYIEAKMSVVPLRCWSCFGCKKNRWNIVPPTKQVPSGFYRPCRCLGGHRSQFGFPTHQETPRRFLLKAPTNKPAKALNQRIGLCRCTK